MGYNECLSYSKYLRLQKVIVINEIAKRSVECFRCLSYALLLEYKLAFIQQSAIKGIVFKLSEHNTPDLRLAVSVHAPLSYLYTSYYRRHLLELKTSSGMKAANQLE